MKKELAEALKTVYLECYPDSHCRVYENYSGRGMYGEETTGLVCESAEDLISAILLSPEYILREFKDNDINRGDITSVRVDSLGFDTIFY